MSSNVEQEVLYCGTSFESTVGTKNCMKSSSQQAKQEGDLKLVKMDHLCDIEEVVEDVEERLFV